MADRTEVHQILTAAEADDGFDCEDATAEEAIKKYEVVNGSIDDNELADSEDLAEEIYSTSKYWE